MVLSLPHQRLRAGSERSRALVRLPSPHSRSPGPPRCTYHVSSTSSTGLIGGPLKNLSDPVSSNYRKIALRPLWAAMAGSPAPSTAGPRLSSERSRHPRAASCCLPTGRGVRRCHASPRRHRRARSSNMVGALVDGLEVDGGARRDDGPSRSLQIGSVSQPRWPATRLHLGALELDLRSTLTIFGPRAPSAAGAR